MAKVAIPNQYFIDLLINMNQTVVIDANLIIPPNRSDIYLKNQAYPELSFQKYANTFLNPMIRIFPKIAIHEAVYKEISNQISIKEYIDAKIDEKSIVLLEDRDLNSNQEYIRNTVEEKISQFTNYNPSIDNSKDRGEVKSISYAVAKNLIYFSTNDSNVISLINRNDLNPYLHSLGAIHVYEMIYVIRKIDGNSKILKGIYKLMYRLTKYEKSNNLDWSSFCEECNKHYSKYFKSEG